MGQISVGAVQPVFVVGELRTVGMTTASVSERTKLAAGYVEFLAGDIPLTDTAAVTVTVTAVVALVGSNRPGFHGCSSG